MNNLKLRNKIFLILVLPILAIFMLSSILIFEKVEKVLNMDKTSSYIEFTDQISKLLANLQKERELSLSYINSYAQTKKDDLENQIKASKLAEENLDTFIKKFYLIKKESKLFDKYETFKTNISLLDEKRTSVKELSKSSKDIENYYDELISELLSFFDELLIYSNSKELLKASKTYISITNIFDKNCISNSNYNNFISLIIFHDADIDELRKNLTQVQLDFFNQKLQSTIFTSIDDFRRAIFLKSEKDNILNTIKKSLGYGGLIHKYKDLILTNNEDILNKIQKEHTKILRAIKDYKRLEHTKEEEKFLDDIQFVADSYMSKSYNNEYLEDTKELDAKILKALNILTKNIYGVDTQKWETLSSSKIEIFEEIKNKIVEDTLLYIKTNTKDLDNQILFFLLFLLLLMIFIFLVIIVMTSKVTKAIIKFENNLNQFFSYSMKEKDNIKLNQIEGKDEVALMTKNMNTQVSKIEQIIENDKNVILEITDIMEKVNNGFFEYSIKTKSSTKELQTLVDIINKMIDRTRLKIDSLNMLLNSYAQGDYKFKLDEIHSKGMYGDFGILSNSTLLLGQSSSSLIAMITNAGKKLEENTKILTNSSNELSISSSNQALSLKQSSVALEQITQNLKNNNSNMNQMLNIADELNNSAISGSNSATQTFSSMDEISKKVKAINEAITVIDQIAFQTNILSLNAAVEAATAGEAGKGFAVVAQEVRNLANKSAQAAKEIKELVESANFETLDGKNNVDTMIKGYENLALKISQTKDIIHNVTIFSKEQELGIVQINETVSKLDFTTQKNAKTAINIDRLSNEVSDLSNKLLQITSASKIDEKYYDMVENVDLIKELSIYKNEHLNFKKRYFKLLNRYENCKVGDCKSCNMGKWIISCESKNEIFTKDEKWYILKNHHENLHEKMQEYITQNSNKSENKVLKNSANEIEEITIKIFDSLNDILYLDSKNNKV